MPHSIVGSVAMGFNIGGPLEDDLVKQKMWEYLGLTRVYTKRKGTDELDEFLTARSECRCVRSPVGQFELTYALILVP